MGIASLAAAAAAASEADARQAARAATSASSAVSAGQDSAPRVSGPRDASKLCKCKRSKCIRQYCICFRHGTPIRALPFAMSFAADGKLVVGPLLAIKRPVIDFRFHSLRKGRLKQMI